MKKIYREYRDHMMIEEDGKFGIQDKSGHLLLPMEYDGITANHGYLLCQKGKFVYVEFASSEYTDDNPDGAVWGDPNGCALAYLPCMYDRVEEQCNGMVVFRQEEAWDTESWFDFKSRTLYRDILWLDNFVDFDSFLVKNADGDRVSALKKAGEDAWVVFSEDRRVHFWREIPLGTVGVRCVLCAEEFEYSDGVVQEYFFLLLYKNGWMTTPARDSLPDLYADLPAITENLIKKASPKDEAQMNILLGRYLKVTSKKLS